MENLFLKSDPSASNSPAPLAERMRPTELEAVIGQAHLLGENGFLSQILQTGQIPSLIFWGPPGTGKTTLARIVASYSSLQFIPFSAVTSGIPEIKKLLRGLEKQKVILFIDEIHRFNKAQQDAFLPYVEGGKIILIGATTENPSFTLNNALLSRVKVIVLHPLQEKDIQGILDRALSHPEKGVRLTSALSEEVRYKIVSYASGDARNALNLLEWIETLYHNQTTPVTEKQVDAIVQKKLPRYDKKGEYHYDLISALHKSLRGCDADAALYYLLRMIDAGEDPMFIARRLVRFSAEDIGLADPFALVLAQNTFTACKNIGYPECDVILAELTLYLALAPKSNRVYQSVKDVMKEINANPSEEIPLFIRNAPTTLMKNIGYGEGYIYPPDTEEGIVSRQYLPTHLQEKEFYHPTENGKEKQFKERWNLIRKRLTLNENK